MYDHVLVPTDGSEGAAAAFERAFDLAETSDARLHLLYVVETVVVGDATFELVERELQQRGEALLEGLADRAEDAGLETVTTVRSGRAGEEILEYVDEESIDLVVAGSQGKTGLDRVLLGSVAETLVRNAPVPVLTVPSPDDTSR